MTRSISRRLLLAGATATAVLTLSVFSGSASASAAPVTTAASGPCGPSLTSHNFALFIDGACVEYIAQIDGLSGNQMTLHRGASGSQSFTNFIHSGLRKNITVAVLDYENRVVKRYNLRNAQVIRYTNNTAVTVRFQELVIS
ncbi:hypothetical protein [Streptomyces europaeiscabiei]|uniref:hypothetical protein n=1 Tax=Streptomyces europaeiscabiei TaxID=146819 RepID=UPI0038F6A2BF